MKRIVIVLAALAITATACETEPFNPAQCDYEQAQTTEPAVTPADRTEWADYNGDGVVVLCMWTGVVG
jgi:hypothetical protein